MRVSGEERSYCLLVGSYFVYGHLFVGLLDLNAFVKICCIMHVRN